MESPPGSKHPVADPGPAPVELFPLEHLDLVREGLFFFPAKAVLDPELGSSPRYHGNRTDAGRRSHIAWPAKGWRG